MQNVMQAVNVADSGITSGGKAIFRRIVLPLTSEGNVSPVESTKNV